MNERPPGLLDKLTDIIPVDVSAVEDHPNHGVNMCRKLTALRHRIVFSSGYLKRDDPELSQFLASLLDGL